MPLINASSKLRLGAADPSKMYVGAQQVWSRAVAAFTEAFSGGDAATWPAAWTHATKPVGASATVANGAGVIAYGSGAAWSAASNTYIVTNTFTIADCDMTLRMSKASAGSTLARIALRDVTPGKTGATCVRVALHPNNVSVWDVSNWAETWINEVAFPHTDGTWYAIRIRLQGLSIRVKVWPDGAAEPAAWLIDATLTTQLAAGRIGFEIGGGASDRTVRVDDVNVYPIGA